jgi:4-amino-4-deoxy-L-arabinose transferase-like glycosyltransferase
MDGGSVFHQSITALLCLELVYVIARELKLSRLASVAAAAVFAVSPFFVVSSIQPVGDAVATFWCLAAVAASLVTRRGSAAWAFAAGLALGVAILVRPGSLVILPAVLVALRWKRTTVPLFLLGTLPPLLVLGFYVGGLRPLGPRR